MTLNAIVAKLDSNYEIASTAIIARWGRKLVITSAHASTRQAAADIAIANGFTATVQGSDLIVTKEAK